MLRLIPGLACAAVAAWLVLSYDVTAAELVRYTLATLWGVLLPGVLLHRLLRPAPASLAIELAFGSVIGLALQLIGWAAVVRLGHGSLLVLVPLVTLVPALLLPGWRRRLRPAAYPQHMSHGSAWALAATISASFLSLAQSAFRLAPIPPARTLWYPDLYWHLSISASARTSAPPLVPQLGDEYLHYHWFSNAHMAADSLVSGVDIMTVTARLWYLPMYALVTLTLYALTTHLSHRPWAGVLACIVLTIPSTISVVRWLEPVANGAFTAMSPSQLMALPVITILAWVLIDVCRGATTRRDWPLLLLLLALASGSKSSILPTLLGGLCLVLVGQLRGRVWRWGPVLALAATGAVLVVSKPWLAGGTNGSKLAPGSTSARETAYHAAQVDGMSLRGLVVLVIVITLLLLVQYAYGMVWLATLRRGAGRDPGLWFLVGSWLAAMVALQVIDHPAASQYYFARGALPLWAALTGWGAAALVQTAREHLRLRRIAVLAGAGLLAGVAMVWLLRHLTSFPAPAPRTSVAQGGGVAIFLLVLLVALPVAIHRLNRRGPDSVRRGAVVALLSGTALLGASVLPTLAHNDAMTRPGQTTPIGDHRLTADEVAATSWLREHTPERDHIASNVYCVMPTRTEPHCDARAFWVTGLSTRVAYLGAWAYTDQNQADITGSTAKLYHRPFWDPARLRLNEAAFGQPTPAVLDRLYRSQVRWLLADPGASAVSPRLRHLATERFRAGGVTVFQLRPPAGR